MQRFPCTTHPGSLGVHAFSTAQHWCRKAYRGKVKLLCYSYHVNCLITLWTGLGMGPVLDICEAFSWASCRTFKWHCRLPLMRFISSAVFRRVSSFCMYHALVLLPQLRSALVNQHSCGSGASPKGRGTVPWSCIVPVSIKFQHSLQSLRLFPGVIRQYIPCMGRPCWVVTHQTLNRYLLMCLNAT